MAPPLCFLPKCFDSRSTLGFRRVSVCAGDGDAAHLRAMTDALQCILVTAGGFQRGCRRLSWGWEREPVGMSVDCAESHPDRPLGAMAAFHAGLAQRTQVSAHQPADVRPQRQVDDGVVDGGGLGKHGRHGKRKRRDVIDGSESSPHGHHSIRAPGSEEADADSDAELSGTRRKEQPEECWENPVSSECVTESLNIPTHQS